MRKKVGANRSLKAESLESRQLLHGGGMVAGEPPTIEERVAGAFERFDANENGELAQEEVPERVWNRISSAEGEDENTSISAEELTAHLESRIAEREANEGEGDTEQGRDREDRGDRNERRRNNRRTRSGNRIDRRGDGERERPTIEQRVDAFFEANDTNSDGLINASDEVSEELLARISDADTSEVSDGVSAEELVSFHEARQQERQQTRFDRFFSRLDDDGNGGVTEDEAGRNWERISAADADSDGSVTADELQSYLDTLREERESEDTNDDEADNGGDSEEAVAGAAADDAGPQARSRRGGRGGGRR